MIGTRRMSKVRGGGGDQQQRERDQPASQRQCAHCEQQVAVELGADAPARPVPGIGSNDVERVDQQQVAGMARASKMGGVRTGRIMYAPSARSSRAWVARVRDVEATQDEEKIHRQLAAANPRQIVEVGPRIARCDSTMASANTPRIPSRASKRSARPVWSLMRLNDRNSARRARREAGCLSRIL